MKRLWMRLGLVAGILGVGGAGVLVAQKSATSPDKTTAVAATNDPTKGDDNQPRPIPLANSSFGSEGNAGTSGASTNVASYANELGSEETSDARYVEAPSAYGGSPASYSINDSDDPPAPTADGYGDSTPQSSYAPASSYASDYSNEVPAAETESGNGSRYGDPAESSAGTSDGSSLQSPQGYADTRAGSQYGGGYESPTYSNELPADTAEAVQAAPALVENDSYDATANDATGYPVAPAVVSDEATLQPPPLREPSIPETSSYAPVATSRPVAQPQLLDEQSAIDPQPVPSGYSSYGSSTPVASIVASPLASDIPGDRQLEGTQTPSLTLEKRAPSEVSVGQTAPFKVIVRNVGNVTAHGVVVTDRIPQGTEFVNASPEFTQTNDGSIAWQLGDLEPGDQVQVSLELKPLVEGEIGSVAQVSFQTQASVRTVSTKPELVVKHTGPDKILIGQDVVFDITLSNPGSGATTGIVIEADVPEGLAHVAGARLEFEVGTLRPKEEKRLQLVLRADKAGQVRNILTVKADAGISKSDQFDLEVIAPELQVAISGAKTRYLERQVVYDIGVNNPGTSTAYDVQLVTFLPKGLKYVSADNKGSYDPGRHAVFWSLAELPATESGTVQLTALPIETGEQKLRVEGTANLNLQTQYEHTTTVQGLTELAFSVQDVHDPIEVGSETMYEIRIVNNGNKVATNVQIAAELPAALQPISGDGPTKVTVEGQVVYMALLAKIAPRDEVVYRIAALGKSAGDHVIAVQLDSDEVSTPVVKQESTKVYADQ